jgi:hypothetical protein
MPPVSAITSTTARAIAMKHFFKRDMRNTLEIDPI